MPHTVVTKKEREQLQKHLRWMNSIPAYLPSAADAFGHIPAKIDRRAYEHMPTKLRGQKKLR